MSEPLFYSDNGVDAVVAEILPEAFGYACDVGANDGINRSNTLHFEHRGWITLCIEANPDLEEAGRKNRRLWRQVAAGPANLEEQEFLAFGCYPHESGSALTPVFQEECNFLGLCSQHRVSVRTLDRLLDEAGFPGLDYLSIDAEGYERQIMSGIDLDRWRPTVMAIESFGYVYPPIPGYRNIARLGFDNLFIREGAI